MHELLAPVFRLLPAMWEKRWWGLAVAWACALLGAIGVAQYKDRYLASATVFVDTQSTLRPLLEGLAVQPDAGQQATMLARTLLSRRNLEAVIERNHLIAADAPALKRELLIQRLGSTIELRVNGRDNIYRLSYVGTDAQQTLGVVRTLLDLFVRGGLADSQRESAQALHFLDAQLAAHGDKLRDIDARIAAFRRQHPGLSEQTGAALALRQGQLQDQLALLQGQLAAAQTSRGAVQAQLADVAPTLSQPRGAAQAAGTPAGGELDARIAAQQRRLDELLQRYTEAYPDVVAARAELSRLQAERRREGVVAAAAAPAPAGRSANPAYQQLRLSLAQADAGVAALQSQIGELRAQLQRIDQQLGAGGVDEAYQQLLRERELLRDARHKLVQRRESAALSNNQELLRRSMDLRIIDPPRRAPVALFPRRTFLVALVLVVSAALGALASYIAVVLFPSYRTVRQLRETTQRAVLGSVALVRTPKEIAHEQRELRLFAGSAAVLVATFATWTVASMLHWIH